MRCFSQRSPIPAKFKSTPKTSMPIATGSLKTFCMLPVYGFSIDFGVVVCKLNSPAFTTTSLSLQSIAVRAMMRKIKRKAMPKINVFRMTSVLCHDAPVSNPTGCVKRRHSRKLVHRRWHVWSEMLRPIPGGLSFQVLDRGMHRERRAVRIGNRRTGIDKKKLFKSQKIRFR